MKVLHMLTSGNPGGIEILCENIANNSSWENYFCFITDGGIVYEQMKKSGKNVILLKDIKNIYKKYKKISKYVREKKIDIINIHHEDIYLELYYLLLKIKYKRIKFVSTYHSCFDEMFYKNDNFLKKRLKILFTQIRFSISDLCIFVSNAGYESHKEKFRIKASKAKVIYNGVTNIKNDNVPSKSNNLLYIGRIIDYKGINVLLESIKKIVDLNINIHLDIVGDGPEMEKCQKYVLDNKIENFVKFYGFDTDKEKYYKKAKFFVYPSLCQEVFGISIVEAMTYGIPCIAFKKGGIPEIISDGRDGFIVENDSSLELAKKIIEVTKIEYEKILELSKKAKQKAIQFDIKENVFKLEKEYINLIK